MSANLDSVKMAKLREQDIKSRPNRGVEDLRKLQSTPVLVATLVEVEVHVGSPSSSTQGTVPDEATQCYMNYFERFCIFKILPYSINLQRKQVTYSPTWRYKTVQFLKITLLGLHLAFIYGQNYRTYFYGHSWSSQAVSRVNLTGLGSSICAYGIFHTWWHTGKLHNVLNRLFTFADELKGKTGGITEKKCRH